MVIKATVIQISLAIAPMLKFVSHQILHFTDSVRERDFYYSNPNHGAQNGPPPKPQGQTHMTDAAIQQAQQAAEVARWAAVAAAQAAAQAAQQQRVIYSSSPQSM